jgi:hypothetical protein
MFIQHHDPREEDFTPLQYTGLLIFIFVCGLPAVLMNGFFVEDIQLSLPVALVIAAVGGLVGGAMMCHQPLAAGLVGGLLAGPLGLLALYAYTFYRTEVWDMELIVVQGVASLPGWGAGAWLKALIEQPEQEAAAAGIFDSPGVANEFQRPAQSDPAAEWSFSNLPETRGQRA